MERNLAGTSVEYREYTGVPIEYKEWKQEQEQTHQKVKAFVESVLCQCHDQGFTISEVRWIVKELSYQVEESVRRREGSAVFAPIKDAGDRSRHNAQGSCKGH